MNELILGAVLVISATLLGCSFSQNLINRRKSLQMLIEVIRKMKTYIGFSTREIESVVTECFCNVKGFECFTRGTEKDNETFLMWWKECVNSLDSSTGLDKNDRELLVRFSEEMGVSDVEGQISNCELYEELFTEQLNFAKEAESKKCRLYKILGFSLGCAVTLIVV